MGENFHIQHVGVVARDVERLAAFYRDVVGLEAMSTPAAQSGRMPPFSWLRMGDHELHVVGRDDDLARDLGITINPSLQPHFAVRIDDLAALKRRLDESETEWIDWGRLGIRGLNQIFVRDPDGNVVEFEQF